MELVHGTRSKASKFATQVDHDFISTMPESVITNILDRLPIRDAVRTGILAKNWRFKWTTMLSQLVFDKKFFKDLLRAQGTNSYDQRNVLKFLLHIKGSITKFILLLPSDMVFDVEEINLWFLFLSGKGIKDVTLKNMHKTPLQLPTHLFSCIELIQLNLKNCCFHPPPSFHGFPNLLSLNFYGVGFENYKFADLITHCPLLENLIIGVYGLFGKVRPVEIAKLQNLKRLTMPLSKLDMRSFTSANIFQLVGSFSKLQKLMLGFGSGELLADAGAGLPTTFPCLKTLGLFCIDLSNDIMVSYVLKMICSSPNLQTLMILATYRNDVPSPTLCSSYFDYSTMELLQLRSVVFACSEGSENEVCFIKSLLVCSPLLKKISIGLNTSSCTDGRLKFAEKLLKLQRASPLAEIDLFYFTSMTASSLLCRLYSC